ncbi:DEAD/DEAH box helicase [Nakamurella leprariae]|uniref:DEAD/DEAH box helicase n=1 Tax=Nakamurella leprariae TaxID=2803911 RepID=A0A939BY67_9ACTN|nr:DEAD/DEAH box helicase [Nakamurella leprariae]MBM9466765.1 DEAD/DEAH box helicase [Nakamurella leprariae]
MARRSGRLPGSLPDEDGPRDGEESAALSPAERYARSRQRAEYPAMHEFAATRPFRLDQFQIDGCRALEDGLGVLVCAPTGAGKTVVGEFAVHRALTEGGKCFYTTPIKALSNQKYADLVAQYGPDRVGLLTGDTSINSHAPVVVMTTEVLRNMLYAGSADLAGLTAVVMDEIHYLADKFRGAVWEEVILHLPSEVQLVGLSATVSNAEEFGSWLQEVRGHTAVVVDEIRPVPLWQHMLVGRRLYDLFSAGPEEGGERHARVDPALTRAVADAESLADRFGGGRRGGPQARAGSPGRGRSEFRGGPRWRPPSRVEVIERLDGNGLLPAITFIFSRAGCDAAVAQCVRSGMRLTTEHERELIRQIVDRRTAELPEADLGVLGYWEWREGLERGIAAHHAGMLPAFKETVEELFVAGLVKAVFATETLALGINMPARTVVLEKLVKFNGEGHVDLTPGEYTQLTGRAGRRGIDVEGHAVVLWSPGVDPRTVGGLASKRTYPLRSSFRPSYNMAVNLVHRLGRSAAKELLEQSFAQFQADAAVVGLARQARRNAESVAQYAQRMQCHLGDTGEYLGLLDEISATEKALARAGSARRRETTARDLAQLRRGDVIAVPAGRRSGLAVVLDPGVDADGQARPLVATSGRWAGRLSAQDFRGPVPALGRLKLGRFTDHRSAKVRRDLASALASSGIGLPSRADRDRDRPAAVEGPGEADLAMLRRTVRAHPVHGCADRDQHVQWARRWSRLRTETDALQRRVEGARGSLGQALERILTLLQERGYVQGDELTPAGAMLARIWSESDLVVAECLRRGTWSSLTGAELAAVVSVLVYEGRREGGPSRAPAAGPVGDAVSQTVRTWAEITGRETELGLRVTREPDAGFVGAVSAWARGGSLAEALTAAVAGGTELSAGDFVRWCRQVIDLLDQLGGVASDPVAAAARNGVRALRRGVVALGAG